MKFETNIQGMPDTIPFFESRFQLGLCCRVYIYLWFKFYFPVFQSHYQTLPYPKTKENKIKTKDKIEPQHL